MYKLNPKIKDKIEKVVGEIKEVHLLAEQGCTSDVYRIVTNDGFFLLKISYKQKYREWLREEARVLENLHILLPVPKYFGFIEEVEGSHLIMSFEQGMTLTSALKKASNLKEKKALIKSFGQFLNQLHETKPSGILLHNRNWLQVQLEMAEKYVENGQADGSRQLLEELKANLPQPVSQTIIHGDCTTDNVLVVDGEVRLFIDVSGMTMGDPRYDESLAIRKFINHEEYMTSFYEGYTRYKVSKEEFQYFDEGLYEFF